MPDGRSGDLWAGQVEESALHEHQWRVGRPHFQRFDPADDLVVISDHVDLHAGAFEGDDRLVEQGDAGVAMVGQSTSNLSATGGEGAAQFVGAGA